MSIERRQKILIPLIILAFGYVAWQIYDMFIADIWQKQPQSVSSQLHVAKDNTTTNQPSTTLAEEQSSQPKLTNGQKEYLALTDELQNLKLRHMILDEQVAIASAKEKIVELNQQTQQLGGPSSTINDTEQVPIHNTTFRLLYLDEQDGKWSAILSKEGHSYEVKDGSALTDNMRVEKIKSDGVILNNKKQRYLLNFTEMAPIKPAVSTATQTKQPVHQELTQQLQQIESNLITQPNHTHSSKNKDEKLLLKVPSNYYTIQLMGARKLPKIRQFLMKQSLKEKVFIFKTNYKGAAWYTLLYGTYPNEKQAAQSLTTLPKSIRKLQPWIRPLSSVQTTIHQGRTVKEQT